MSQPHRLAADAAHEFGGIELDRSKPLEFRLNGRRIQGFAGDTVLSAALAAGIDGYGQLGETTLALTDRFAPLASSKGGAPLPIDRVPAVNGLDLTTIGPRRFRLGRQPSLGHRIDGIAEAPWLRARTDATLTTDLLIVGGGVAGLAAAAAAADAGRNVVLVERRAWLGGDARYFGAVGDEQSPEAVTNALIAKLATQPNVSMLTHADAFALHGATTHVHHIEQGRGRVVAVTARRILLATGSIQRLPIFAGNRLPGVATSIAAYHFAKRYGVSHGASAVVATQSNYGYRLAHRLHDAGVAIRRVVDPRINAQSRFVDFSKASGLNMSGGHLPVSAEAARHGLHLSFGVSGATIVSLELDADQLIVSGPFQPDLALWMLAGGGTHWLDGRLQARGAAGHVMLAGAAAGYRSMRAAIASGIAAEAQLFGGDVVSIEDIEIGAPFETPEGPAMVGPTISGAPAFFDSGTSLIARTVPGAKPVLTTHAQAPALGDVAASVELGITSPVDAGAVAEERGAPGGDLSASSWRPVESTSTGTPAWLTGRFGDAPVERHLVVDAKRKFARGALVYANTNRADPALAIGVIIAVVEGKPGGLALLSIAALTNTERFIVETLDGPSPARIAAG